ncbi:MAG: alpha/beta hydrolase [Streptosporangiales bacterium]|nr:alpha/beta hydrolase [Streptosporangiales bacterium]
MTDNGLSLDYRVHAGSDTGPVLLLLHGTGGTPDDLVGLGRQLFGDAPMLAPAGPVSEFGAARWFRRLAEGVFDTDDVVERAHQLADFVAAATERHGLVGRPLIAIGFSNGANIAAATLLLRPEVLQTAVLFSSMLPVPQPPAHDLSATKVFLANGTADPMAPIASTDQLVSELQQRGADVGTYRHPGGHQITVDALAAARDWAKELVAA